MRRKQKEAQETRPGDPATDAKRVTPVDIQQKEFRLAFRGYNERDVDQFLDEVTEEVARLHAENKRLREEVSFKRTAPFDRGGVGEADAIVRQAREEAARIVGEAQARASIVGTPGAGLTPSGLLGPFLAREREFLQGLAALIQGHADAVKDGIRRAREEFARGTEGVRAQEAMSAEHMIEEAAASGSAEGFEPAEPQMAEEEAPVREPVLPEHEASLADAAEASQERASEVEEERLDVTSEGSRDGGGEEEDRSNATAPGVAHAQSEPWRPRERVMDLTDEATAAQEPEPASAVPGDREDRSLREFFWGED